jgi:predicted ABC-type sugar transport system permease subunit
MSIGMAYGTYAMVAVPYSITLEWFILGVLINIVMGIVASLVYGKKPAQGA